MTTSRPPGKLTFKVSVSYTRPFAAAPECSKRRSFSAVIHVTADEPLSQEILRGEARKRLAAKGHIVAISRTTIRRTA